MNMFLPRWVLWNHNKWGVVPLHCPTDERNLRIWNHSLLSRPLPLGCGLQRYFLALQLSWNRVWKETEVSDSHLYSWLGTEKKNDRSYTLKKENLWNLSFFFYCLVVVVGIGCCARCWTQGLLYVRQVLLCCRVLCIVIRICFQIAIHLPKTGEHFSLSSLAGAGEDFTSLCQSPEWGELGYFFLFRLAQLW